MRSARLPFCLCMLAGIGCTNATLHVVEPVEIPVRAVRLTTEGLSPQDQRYFERITARVLNKGTDVSVTREPVDFVPRARGEFTHYYRGSAFLMAVTSGIIGRPEFDATWTIEDPREQRTLAVCEIRGWRGWAQLSFGTGMKRVVVYGAHRLYECLTGESLD